MRTFCAALIILGFAVPAGRSADEPRDSAGLGFIKGYTWGASGGRGSFAAPAAADSMQKLADTGANWVCIAFGATMATHDNPEIPFAQANPRMVTDEEIRHAIHLARDNRMQVILKPMVNCRDGTWRAWIRFFRPITEQERAAGITGEMDPWQSKPAVRDGEVKDLEKWDRWWRNFSAFVLHYAELAEAEHVPALCLGCEMNSTEEFEDRWRSLIAEVRKVYHGQLTYNVNHDREDKVQWWDAVDLISISAYYAIPPAAGRPLDQAVQQTTSLAEIVAGLQPVKRRSAQISAQWHKPILFIETGVINARGFARYPWTHGDAHPDSPMDEQEQANYYEAMMEVFWSEPWCMGFTWWDWPARLYESQAAPTQRSFCIYGRKAEAVLRQWYAKPRQAPDVTVGR